ncbi:hypothetical protein [Amycolatopsis sp. cmx-11-12]|uniref:hypothetical protein n=1 Tax=Amycolatopsis sp. cmx-11-12 TaxID=2785795 RepID=UPI0039186388
MPGQEPAPTPHNRSTTRRVVTVSIVVLVVLGALCGASFIPKVANHFGYALPGEEGLPYRVHYNGRDYRNNLTCAGAQWCAGERTPEPYCTPRAGLDLGEGNRETGLVKVDDVFTMFGPSHPVFTAGVPQGEVVTRVIVEAFNDCYLIYGLMGGP